MSEQDVPLGETPEPIPMARVWTPPPMPPPPMPALPVSGPDYGSYGQFNQWAMARPAKPGVVTALGTLSIVVASLTFVACVICLMVAVGQYTMAKVARQMAFVAQQQNHPIPVPAPAGLPAGPNGLGPTERDIVVRVFSAKQRLSKPRQAQLDALLADGGQQILGATAGSVTAQKARSAIQSAYVRRSAHEGDTGPAIFVTQGGTMELYDTHAVFRPDDRTIEPVRVAADASAYALVHADPATLALNGRQPSVAVAPPPLPPVQPGYRQAATRAERALGAVLGETGLSAALAVYLLVIGIVTVRGSRSGAITHWIFVIAKTLLVVIAVYAWVTFEESLRNLKAMSSVALPGGASAFPANGDFAPVPTTMSVFAVAFVILLVVLLLTPTAREFYKKA